MVPLQLESYRPISSFLRQDLGQSILESYSRVMESLAFNIMARIDDVLYVDDATKQCAAAESMSFISRGGFDGLPILKRISPSTPLMALHLGPQPSVLPLLCSKAQVGHLHLQTLILFPSTNYWLVTWRTCGHILGTSVPEESPTMLPSAIDLSRVIGC